MDFQKVVDGIGAMTCVISVEKLKNGGYGKIRIVTGNRAYLDSIEHPQPGTELLTTEFIPNSEYTRYLTRDLNFEDFCYRAAVEKKCLHSYVHPERINAWFNMTFLPLVPDDGDLCYCTYTMEINFEASAERMSNVSGELASAVLETSLKLRGARDFRAAMGSVIRDIRELCQAEYCCILLMETQRETCSVLCEDMAEDSTLQPTGSLNDASFYAVAASWEDTISGSNCLIVKNDQDMEVVRQRNSAWHDSLQANGVKTIALFPLKSPDSLLGYIWATNFDADKAGRIKETLELTSFVLSSEIANYLLLRQLRVLSAKDLLTGVNNRNAMNNRVTDIVEGKEGSDQPFGVVFADLNGLKTINDAQGHNAGDLLLKKAAILLQELFDGNDIYRAGGDEFVVLLTGCTREALAQKVHELRERSDTPENVCFAVGSYYAEAGFDIRDAMRLADENMYADKKAFYQAHPESDRRLQTRKT